MNESSPKLKRVYDRNRPTDSVDPKESRSNNEKENGKDGRKRLRCVDNGIKDGSKVIAMPTNDNDSSERGGQYGRSLRGLRLLDSNRRWSREKRSKEETKGNERKETNERKKTGTMVGDGDAEEGRGVIGYDMKPSMMELDEKVGRVVNH